MKKMFSRYLQACHELHVFRQLAELVVVQQQFVQFNVLQHVGRNLARRIEAAVAQNISN